MIRIKKKIGVFYMSLFLKEVTSEVANKLTKPGGLSASCVSAIAQLPIAAALCAQSGGYGCSCKQYQNLATFVSKYCR